MNQVQRIIAAVCLGASSPLSYASVLSATDRFFMLRENPSTAVPNTTASTQSDRIQVIMERRGMVVPAGVPGLQAGIKVDSYLLHFDPQLSHRAGREWSRFFRPPAKIEFKGNILAIYSSDEELDATDIIFGTSIDYPTGLIYRGTGGPKESVDRFSKSKNSITYYQLFVRDSNTEPGTDQIRVVVESDASLEGSPRRGP